MSTLFYPNWREKVTYSENGPAPQILEENDQIKVVLAGLEPHQRIPAHPEALAVYHILEGNGIMTVDNERLPVQTGSIVITPQGASRGLEAETRLAFIAVRIRES